MTHDMLDVFLHIPKTAGTSFNTLLTRAYGAKHVIHASDKTQDNGLCCFDALSEEKQKETRLLRGHIVHGLHRHTDRPVRYFTVLRNPRSRIRSFLNHMASEAALSSASESPWYQAIRNWEGFESFAQIRPRQVDNGMVRILSGTDFAPGACTDDILELAKRNLDAMPAFGIQEHLPESLLVMKHAMHWKVIPVISRTKSNNPQRIKLTDHDDQAIDRLNRFDNALYDYACDRFEQRLTSTTRIQAKVIKTVTPLVTQLETAVRRIRGR